MKLYGREGSGQIICAYVIKKLQLDCDIIFVDEPFTNSDAFRAISPYGRVPALETDTGEAIFESLAITLYLLEQDKANSLSPSREDPAYGRFLSWMAYLATTFYDACLRWHYPDRYGESSSTKAMADQELDTIYDHVEREPHDWLAGTEKTIADCYLYMMMTWDEGRKRRLETRPKMKRIFDAIQSDKTMQEIMAVHDRDRPWN